MARLIAHARSTALETIKARLRIHVLSWVFVMRADDGNRTRAINLGIKGRCPPACPDLLIRLLTSDPC